MRVLNLRMTNCA